MIFSPINTPLKRWSTKKSCRLFKYASTLRACCRLLSWISLWGHDSTILDRSLCDFFIDPVLTYRLLFFVLSCSLLLSGHHFTEVIEPAFHLVHLCKFIEGLRDDFCVIFSLISLNLDFQLVLNLEALLANRVTLDLELQHLINVYATRQSPFIGHPLSCINFDLV